MYLSTIGRPKKTGDPDAGPDRRRRRFTAVGANVLALGSVSLITDISSEMVTSILPIYLMIGLHLSPAAYGVVDGLYTGATALLRLVGGYLADRISKRKLIAGLGYGLSAVAKLGLLAAGSSAAAIGAVITVDRTGKGLRTAPRDALITLSAPESMLGRAFGIHRAMDSAGAFAGPLVALAVLSAVGSAAGAEAFSAVFVVSFCIAALAVLLLVLFVRDHRAVRRATGAVSPRTALNLLRDTKVRRLLVAACVLGLATVGDGFVYLLLQRKDDIATGWFPLLVVGTNLAYLLLAAPLGVVADRIGRLPVVVGGYCGLVVVYLLLASPMHGWPTLVLTLALYGAFYAATDGVLMALAGPVLPDTLRTTGIALIQTGQALAYFVSSVGFGLAWQYWGTERAVQLAGVAAVVAILATVALLTTRPTAPTTSEITR